MYLLEMLITWLILQHYYYYYYYYCYYFPRLQCNGWTQGKSPPTRIACLQAGCSLDDLLSFLALCFPLLYLALPMSNRMWIRCTKNTLNLLWSLKAISVSFADPREKISRSMAFFDQSKPLGALPEYEVERASSRVKSALPRRSAPDRWWVPRLRKSGISLKGSMPMTFVFLVMCSW